MKLKKTFDDSCSRNTSGWAFSSIDWRLSEQTLLSQWDNINATLSSFFFHSRARLNVICYCCQEKDHYSNNCIKSMNNSNKIHIFSVTSLKKENVMSKPQCWHNISKLRDQLKANSEQQSHTQSTQNQESYVLAQSCSEWSEKLVHKKMCSERLFSG